MMRVSVVGFAALVRGVHGADCGVGIGASKVVSEDCSCGGVDVKAGSKCDNTDQGKNSVYKVCRVDQLKFLSAAAGDFTTEGGEKLDKCWCKATKTKGFAFEGDRCHSSFEHPYESLRPACDVTSPETVSKQKFEQCMCGTKVLADKHYCSDASGTQLVQCSGANYESDDSKFKSVTDQCFCKTFAEGDGKKLAISASFASYGGKCAASAVTAPVKACAAPGTAAATAVPKFSEPCLCPTGVTKGSQASFRMKQESFKCDGGAWYKTCEASKAATQRCWCKELATPAFIAKGTMCQKDSKAATTCDETNGTKIEAQAAGCKCGSELLQQTMAGGATHFQKLQEFENDKKADNAAKTKNQVTYLKGLSYTDALLVASGFACKDNNLDNADCKKGPIAATDVTSEDARKTHAIKAGQAQDDFPVLADVRCVGGQQVVKCNTAGFFKLAPNGANRVSNISCWHSGKNLSMEPLQIVPTTATPTAVEAWTTDAAKCDTTTTANQGTHASSDAKSYCGCAGKAMEQSDGVCYGSTSPKHYPRCTTDMLATQQCWCQYAESTANNAKLTATPSGAEKIWLVEQGEICRSDRGDFNEGTTPANLGGGTAVSQTKAFACDVATVGHKNDGLPSQTLVGIAAQTAGSCRCGDTAASEILKKDHFCVPTDATKKVLVQVPECKASGLQKKPCFCKAMARVYNAAGATAVVNAHQGALSGEKAYVPMGGTCSWSVTAKKDVEPVRFCEEALVGDSWARAKAKLDAQVAAAAAGACACGKTATACLKDDKSVSTNPFADGIDPSTCRFMIDNTSATRLRCHKGELVVTCEEDKALFPQRHFDQKKCLCVSTIDNQSDWLVTIPATASETNFGKVKCPSARNAAPLAGKEDRQGKTTILETTDVPHCIGDSTTKDYGSTTAAALTKLKTHLELNTAEGQAKSRCICGTEALAIGKKCLMTQWTSKTSASFVQVEMNDKFDDATRQARLDDYTHATKKPKVVVILAGYHDGTAAGAQPGGASNFNKAANEVIQEHHTDSYCFTGNTGGIDKAVHKIVKADAGKLCYKLADVKTELSKVAMRCPANGHGSNTEVLAAGAMKTFFDEVAKGTEVATTTTSMAWIYIQADPTADTFNGAGNLAGFKKSVGNVFTELPKWHTGTNALSRTWNDGHCKCGTTQIRLSDPLYQNTGAREQNKWQGFKCNKYGFTDDCNACAQFDGTQTTFDLGMKPYRICDTSVPIFMNDDPNLGTGVYDNSSFAKTVPNKVARMFGTSPQNREGCYCAVFKAGYAAAAGNAATADVASIDNGLKGLGGTYANVAAWDTAAKITDDAATDGKTGRVCTAPGNWHGAKGLLEVSNENGKAVAATDVTATNLRANLGAQVQGQRCAGTAANDGEEYLVGGWTTAADAAGKKVVTRTFDAAADPHSADGTLTDNLEYVPKSDFHTEVALCTNDAAAKKAEKVIEPGVQCPSGKQCLCVYKVKNGADAAASYRVAALGWCTAIPATPRTAAYPACAAVPKVSDVVAQDVQATPCTCGTEVLFSVEDKKSKRCIGGVVYPECSDNVINRKEGKCYKKDAGTDLTQTDPAETVLVDLGGFSQEANHAHTVTIDTNQSQECDKAAGKSASSCLCELGDAGNKWTLNVNNDQYCDTTLDYDHPSKMQHACLYNSTGIEELPYEHFYGTGTGQQADSELCCQCGETTVSIFNTATTTLAPTTTAKPAAAATPAATTTAKPYTGAATTVAPAAEKLPVGNGQFCQYHGGGNHVLLATRPQCPGGEVAARSNGCSCSASVLKTGDVCSATERTVAFDTVVTTSTALTSTETRHVASAVAIATVEVVLCDGQACLDNKDSLIDATNTAESCLKPANITWTGISKVCSSEKAAAAAATRQLSANVTSHTVTIETEMTLETLLTEDELEELITGTGAAAKFLAAIKRAYTALGGTAEITAVEVDADSFTASVVAKNVGGALAMSVFGALAALLLF
jgi:hypothetical protein